MAVAGSCLIYLFRKFFTLKQSDSNNQREEVPHEAKHESQKEPPKKLEHEVSSEVCHAFLMYADNFRGLYETVHKASTGKISLERMQNVFTEWNIRMDNIPNMSTPLKCWWEDVFDGQKPLNKEELQLHLQGIVQMIESCGIIRDDRKELVVQEDTSLYYQSIDDEAWSIGQTRSVETPCWYLPCQPVRVLEKGYC